MAWDGYRAPPPAGKSADPLHDVVVRGLDIPFGDLVWLLVKLSVAAIPAVLILSMAVAALLAALGLI